MRRIGAGLTVAGLLVLVGLAALSLVTTLTMSGCTGKLMDSGGTPGAAGTSGTSGADTGGGPGGASVPTPAPLVGRVPRRMSADQVRATFLELTGVPYTGLATVRDPDAPTGETKNPAADLLDAYASALGRADYNYVVHENLEPGISFSKLVLDAARFTCAEAAQHELGVAPGTGPAHLLLKATPTDALPAGETAIRANIAALMVRFWGQVLTPDDVEVTHVLELFRTATATPAWTASDKTMRPAGSLADGWRVVCIALASSPEFYVY